VIPQALGSSGGHIGTGMALVFATETLVCAEAEAIWVEAAAPVRARTTTNARITVFMRDTPVRLNVVGGWFQAIDIKEGY